MFVGATAVMFLSWVALEVAVVATQRFGLTAWALLHVTFLIALSGLVAGFHRLALSAIDGREVRFSDLFLLMDRGPGLLLAFLLGAIAVAAGTVVLLAPGLYLAVRLSLLGQVAATGRRSPIAMLTEAASLTRRHWWAAARTLATVILLNVLGAAVLGLGLLVAWPVSVLLATGFYRSLRPS